MKKRISLVALGCTLAWPLAGQAASQESGAIVLDEVVVTATRQEEKVSSVPADVTVIDQRQIADSTARTVPDLLRTVKGIHVSDITGNGRSFTVDLRGFGETAGLNTLVLVDGRRINVPDLSGTDWTLIPLDRVQRIEIVRGGQGSVLYGDNAAGGVVNIITKDGGPTMYGAEVAAGSYGTFASRVSAAGSADDLSYALSGSYSDTDGYRDNSGSEAKNAGVSLRYFLGDRAAFDLSSDYHKDDTGLPGYITETQLAQGVPRTATEFPEDFSRTEDYYVKSGAEFFFLNESSFCLDLSYRERRAFSHWVYSGFPVNYQTDLDNIAVSPHFKINERLWGLENSMITGMDYRDDNLDIENGNQLKKKNYGYYVHDELSLFPKLSASGGVRYDRAEYDTPSKKNFDETLYTFGLNYDFLRRSSAYFSYSRSFRYPVLDEINFSPATGLIPQTSDDYEVGVRHDWTDKLHTELNLFLLNTEDEIFYNPLTPNAFGGLGLNINLNGMTRRQGVEVTIAKDFGWALLSGSYTYTDATIRDGQFAGNEVPNVPENLASLRALVPLPGGFSLALNGSYVGKRRFISDFANAFPKMDSYLVLNAKLKYNWRNMSAYLNVNNLLDKEYSDYGVVGYDSSGNLVRAYYPSPEINFLAGVSLSF
jgi:iron complex outermembrane receptor protein